MLMMLAGALACGRARADGRREGDAVMAEAQFREALDLLKAGDWARACTLFASSQALDPSTSTLLKISRCHQHDGRFLQAWDVAQQARALNREQNTAKPERQAALEAYAVSLGDELLPSLARLRVVVRGQLSDRVAVHRDGSLVPTESLGETLLVEAGAHVITWSGPGVRQGSIAVSVGAGETREVTASIEAEEKPYTPPITPRAPSSTAEEPGGAAPAPPRIRTGAKGIAALALGGAAVVSLGVAGYFGVKMVSRFNASSPYCDAANRCLSAGLAMRREASRAQTAALVSLGVGAALGGAGVAVLWTDRASGAPAVEGALVGWRGQW